MSYIIYGYGMLSAESEWRCDGVLAQPITPPSNSWVAFICHRITPIHLELINRAYNHKQFAHSCDGDL